MRRSRIGVDEVIDLATHPTFSKAVAGDNPRPGSQDPGEDASKISSGLSKDGHDEVDLSFGSDVEFDGPDLAPVFAILDGAELDLVEGGERSQSLQLNAPDDSEGDATADVNVDADESIEFSSNVDTDSEDDAGTFRRKTVRRMYISQFKELNENETKSGFVEDGSDKSSNEAFEKFEAVSSGRKKLGFSEGSDIEADRGFIGSEPGCASPDQKSRCGILIRKAIEDSQSVSCFDNKLAKDNIDGVDVNSNNPEKFTRAQSGTSLICLD